MVLFTKVRNYTRNLDNHTYRLLDEGINYLTDLFSNFKAVQIHNGQKTEEKKWENWNDEVIKASKKSYVFHHVILNLSSEDRKSTRLNSSHVAISYAVFCLKKKKNI